MFLQLQQDGQMQSQVSIQMQNLHICTGATLPCLIRTSTFHFASLLQVSLNMSIHFHSYRLNGDYNPLHATPEPGKSLGYGGTIMHGLYSWNITARAVLSQFGGSEGRRLRDFEAMFSSPVKPGDKLDILMWDMGVCKRATSAVRNDESLQEVRFMVKVGDRVVLSNGKALLKCEDEGVKAKL